MLALLIRWYGEKDNEGRVAMEKNAREYYEENFQKKLFVEKLESKF